MGLFQHLRRLVFPDLCPGCGNELLAGEKAVCWGCLTQFETTGFANSPDSNELWYRFAGKVPLEGAAACFYFDKKGGLQKIIQCLKYQGQKEIGVVLGRYFGSLLVESGWPRHFEALVPVPLHVTREAERGYNQSERIAAGLSESLEIPVIRNVLVRRVATHTQTQKGKGARWDNVKDAFELAGDLPDRVLLVDDVVTTGATLEACCRTLTEGENGGRKVGILSIAIARKG